MSKEHDPSLIVDRSHLVQEIRQTVGAEYLLQMLAGLRGIRNGQPEPQSFGIATSLIEDLKQSKGREPSTAVLSFHENLSERINQDPAAAYAEVSELYDQVVQSQTLSAARP